MLHYLRSSKQHLFAGTNEKNHENFMFFSGDMLHKICGKYGYVSRKYTNAVCLETILKVLKDQRAYKAIEPNSSTNLDSSNVQCQLLNAIMNDAFVTQFQMLCARKEMAYLDGAGQDEEFWEHVAIELSKYDKENDYVMAPYC
jgi:hypothetical protein